MTLRVAQRGPAVWVAARPPGCGHGEGLSGTDGQAARLFGGVRGAGVRVPQGAGADGGQHGKGQEDRGDRHGPH